MDPEQLQVLQGLATLINQATGGARRKHDLPTGFTESTNLMHGPVGIFGAAGLDRGVFSTRITPQGLSSVLPARGTNDDAPLVAYMTGFTDDEGGAEQTNKCDDPLEAGNLKSCIQTSQFGRIARKTDPLALVDIGRRVNRGEFFDLIAENDPLMSSGFGVPNLPTNLSQAFNSEVVARLLTLASAFENKIYPMIYTGNPANNTGGDGYKEFDGLERLVTETHTDVITATNCPSLASDIKNFNYHTVENHSAELFAVMTMVWRFVNHNRSRMNFGAVRWAWVMRPEMFNQIVDIWPCVYATAKCAGSAGNPNGTDAMAMRAMSDEMRNGSYLKIDGVNIDVIQDDAIPEATNTTNANVPSGSFASDIYLLPLTVRGGRIVTYFEYFNYENGAGRAIADARLGDVAYVSDGGRFLWYSQFTNGCFSLAATVEPRLRLLVPQLAGRIQNVVATPLQHYRSPFNDSAYFVNGGVQVRDNISWD